MVWDNTNHLNVCGGFGETFTLGSSVLTDSPGYSVLDFNNAFAAKLDTAANVIWAQKAGGFTVFNSIGADLSGNVYVTGESRGSVQPFLGHLINFHGDVDVVLAKYDNASNVNYASCIGGDNYDVGKAITVDVTGNIYVTGYFQSPSMIIGGDVLDGGYFEMFAARFNPSLPSGTPAQLSALPSLQLYPVPNHGECSLYVSSPATEDVSIIITNVLGSKLSAFTTTTNQTSQLHISEVPGLYFITATTSTQTLTSKIVVQ